MKLVKVTNPEWLWKIAPRINDFSKELKGIHVTYENLMSYFATSIQSAQIQNLKYDVSEFWVVMYEDDPKAFAHWSKRPLPHIGKVYFDVIHSWSKSPKAIFMLIDEFIEFGKRHRATIYECDFINQKIFDGFKNYTEKVGISCEKTGIINCISRKVSNESISKDKD